MLKRSELPESFQGNVYKDKVREGSCGVWDPLRFLCLVGGEIIGSQHHQPSGSNPSGIYKGSSIQLTST